MRLKLELLDKPLIEDPGVRVARYVEDLLRAVGITVKDGVAHIPEVLARRLLDLVPRGFCLYDRLGKPAVHYTGDSVHFRSRLVVSEHPGSRTAAGAPRRLCRPPTPRAR